MGQPSYLRDNLAYRREVMVRTVAGATGSNWAASEAPFADYLLTKHTPAGSTLTLVKVYEAMPPGTGDICIDSQDWIAGWTAARVLSCSFGILRRTPKGVQMAVHDGKNMPRLEVASGVVEVRIPADWFSAEVELPNGQTWDSFKVG